MPVQRKVPSFLLPEGSVASTEPQTFAGIPGVFHQGRPVSLDSLELTSEQAHKMIDGKDTPLEIVAAIVEEGEDLSKLDREELRDLAAERQIEVTRAEGEGDPTKSDYLRVFGEAGVEVSDDFPIAGRHYDEEALERGATIPLLPSGARISSAPEGHLPSGEPIGLTPEQEAAIDATEEPHP